jgi:hypothetical protein
MDDSGASLAKVASRLIASSTSRARASLEDLSSFLDYQANRRRDIGAELELEVIVTPIKRCVYILIQWAASRMEVEAYFVAR